MPPDNIGCPLKKGARTDTQRRIWPALLRFALKTIQLILWIYGRNRQRGPQKARGLFGAGATGMKGAGRYKRPE